MTEKQIINNMKQVVVYNKQIKVKEQRIEKLRHKAVEVETVSLMKLLNGDQIVEFLNSISIFDNHEIVNERIKIVYGLSLEDSEASAKIALLNEEADALQEKVDAMYEKMREGEIDEREIVFQGV